MDVFGDGEERRVLSCSVSSSISDQRMLARIFQIVQKFLASSLH